MKARDALGVSIMVALIVGLIVVWAAFERWAYARALEERDAGYTVDYTYSEIAE